MSRKTFELNYKESQMVKHALQNNIQQKSINASFSKGEEKEKYLKDIEEEGRLLERVKVFVDDYKKYIGKE